MLHDKIAKKKNESPKFFIPIHDNYNCFYLVKVDKGIIKGKLREDGVWSKYSDGQNVLYNTTYFKQIPIEEAALL